MSGKAHQVDMRREESGCRSKISRRFRNPAKPKLSPHWTNDSLVILWSLSGFAQRRIEGHIRKDLRWAQPEVEVGWILLKTVDRRRAMSYLALRRTGSGWHRSGVRDYRKIGPVRHTIEQAVEQKREIAAEMRRIVPKERCIAAVMCRAAEQVPHIAVEVQ